MSRFGVLGERCGLGALSLLRCWLGLDSADRLRSMVFGY